MSFQNVIPKEINEHFRLYSKEPWEVQFNEECGVCDNKIDEFGLCGCDTGGGIERNFRTVLVICIFSHTYCIA